MSSGLADRIHAYVEHINPGPGDRHYLTEVHKLVSANIVTLVALIDVTFGDDASGEALETTIAPILDAIETFSVDWGRLFNDRTSGVTAPGTDRVFAA